MPITAKSKFTGVVAYGLFLCAVFVGDFKSDETAASPFVLFFIVTVLLLISRPRLKAGTEKLWILFAVVHLLLLFNSGFNEYYYVLVPVTLFPLVYIFTKPLVRPSSVFVVGSAAILVIGTLVMISRGGGLDVRTSFIFGPNILYRVYATFIALVLFVPCERSYIIQAVSCLGVGFGLYGIVLTGSRGALLELLCIFLVWIVQNNRRAVAMLIVLAIAFLSILISGLLSAWLVKYRMLRFSSELESVAVRIEAYSSISKFLELPVDYLMFGYEKFQSLTRIMPHNLFLEALLANGFVYAFLLFLGVCIYFYRFSINIRNPNAWWFDIPLLAGFVGAQVSGTFAHNYSAISVAFVGYLWLISKRTRTGQV